MFLRANNQALRIAATEKAAATLHQATATYMQAREKLEATRVELQRCRIVLECGTNRGMLRARMRESVLEQAHIVFVTLSSSALKEIAELGSRVRFEVVIVDEAAQAVEPSVLVPLQHGAEHCVLVGDPKQLPATVLSDRVAARFYQQSLFERLQNCGHPCTLLNTQYRCHPLISAFPSRIFYGGLLQDGANVRQDSYHLDVPDLPPITELITPLLEAGAVPLGSALTSPLTFLNLAAGRETRVNMSYRNEAEAQLVLNVYDTLRNKVPGTRGVGIGVITAYRDQLDVLRQRFRERGFQKDPLLDMNTVDGYQGREYDVIIFSCVRAAASDDEGKPTKGRVSIGFLNDQRRLNVAITRAKYMLVVIGQARALEGSKLWRGFMEHVKEEGRFLTLQSPDQDLLNAPVV